MLEEFISQIFREIVLAVVYFDSPSQHKTADRLMLERRTAPYRTPVILTYVLLIVLLIGLSLWVIISPQLPLPTAPSFIVGLLHFTLGVPLVSALIGLLRPGKWKFADFHAACAGMVGLGPQGFGVGLLLLHLLLLLIFCISTPV